MNRPDDRRSAHAGGGPPDDTDARLRTLLIAARKQAGLTQVEVARRLDKPQSFVSKYERGERRLDVVEFLQVAAALKTDPYQILDRLQDSR